MAGLAHVGWKGDGAPSAPGDLCRQRPQLRRAACRQEQRATCFGQAASHDLAQSRGSPGDDGRLSGQAEAAIQTLQAAPQASSRAGMTRSASARNTGGLGLRTTIAA
jgi:hypothetical protein